MRHLRTVAALLAGLVAAICAGSFVVPQTWRVERSIEIDAGAPVVFSFLDTYEGWVEWAAWARELDATLDFVPGRVTEGKGTTVTWVSNGAPAGQLEILVSVPPERIDYVVGYVGQDHQIKGTFTLKALEGGHTLVTWTESGRIPSDPVHRYLAVLARPAVVRRLDRALASLATAAEKRSLAPDLAPQPAVVMDPRDEPIGAGAAYEGP